MLNQELQKEIDLEIDKAKDEIKDFIRSKYFTDTMELIERVNKLTEEQSESIELEVIMFLLGISDYKNIEEAVKDQAGLVTGGEVKQVSKDINDYILDKINPTPNIRTETDKAKNEPLRNIIQDAYGKEMLGPKVLNYYDGKRNKTPLEGEVSDKVEGDAILKDNILKQSSSPSKVAVPKISMNDVSYDVYREKPSEEDNIMKREVEIDHGESDPDDIIRSE
ncbi:MAG: hypothetical protein QG614_52 [Patescibacteria group bacterium]|nr:hypothetical protein [Patescibacteria group bacterium]